MRIGKQVCIAIVGLLIWSVSSGPAVAEYSPQKLTISGAIVSESDPNPVSLDSDWYLPETLPAPAIVLAHGFGGSKESVADQANKLREAGYVVLAYTARGFGNSTGLISMNSPQFEIADAAKIIDFLGTKSEVIQDAPNDPQVGFAGASYGGALSLMIAGTDNRVDAVVSDITWNNLENALFAQGIPETGYPGVFKELWTGFFFSRGLIQLDPSAAPNNRCGRFSPQWCELYETVAEAGTYSMAQGDVLMSSSPISTNPGINVPTMLLAGQADSLFPLSEADANYQQIKQANPDVPLKFVWHSGGHDGGQSESARLQTLTQRWFDTHLRNTDSLSNDFEVTFASANIIGSNRDNSEPASIEISPDYLGISNFGSNIPLVGQAQQVLAPAGGAPAGISTFPGIGSLGGLIGQSLPGQTAIFQSPELEQDLKIVGSSQVQLNVSSDESRENAVLFASLQIVSATGTQTLPNGLVSPIRISQVGQTPTTVLVNLPTIAFDAKQGESLRLVISTTDLAHRLPTQPAVYTIELANPALALASMELAPTFVAQSSITYLWYALAAVAAVVFLVWILRPRNSKSEIRAELTEVPIAIENLVKQFKNGPRAVNDITYQIPRGEVVGLLGPNGAGKTTTMRMIMGLIMPSEGNVYVFGERVHPGAPVLARIGSLVEGAGFLPHLSGRDNLALYWKASGRSELANFEEVLEIADLGTAIDRKVRTYSQGMRQRLGIAQAMLGMPDILMLDEPTNGLDPPQIKAMRDVLHKYAATGRTVIVSSHLLSEVEQTCSYVIVMHRGQLITAGNVGELLASHNNMRLEDFFLDAVGDDLTIGRS